MFTSMSAAGVALVTIGRQSLVRPSLPTPSGELQLSPFDRSSSVRRMVHVLYVYEKGQEPARTIRWALSQALVPYYPMAGRLVGDSNDLRVACSADGVWFAEATANCTLLDVGQLQECPLISKEDFFPNPSPSIGEPFDPLMMIQVTEFRCGGFSVGITYNHVMMDGSGFIQFFNALGEMARGNIARLEPIWRREALPNPPPQRRRETAPNNQPPMKLSAEYLTVDFSSGYIEKLKKQVTEETGRVCTKFDVAAAKVWQSRARARAAKMDDMGSHLSFMADVRHLLRKSKHIGRGYYGNCFLPLTATATSSLIAEAPLTEIVMLIQEAKRRLPAEFQRWATGEGTSALNINDDTLIITDWTRFVELDLGWGLPIHMGPVEQSDYIASCVVVRGPAPELAVRLRTRCVRKEQAKVFLQQMEAPS